MKTFTLKVNEDELKALISHNTLNHLTRYDVETSARIHDLTKRLNRDTPEIEADPRPGVGTVEKANTENAGWPESRKSKKRGVKQESFGDKITAIEYSESFMKATAPKILTLCDQLEETVTRLENKISNSIARINSLI